MAKRSPSVSVLMPCYNAEATLEEALDSLFCQSFTDFEIVAVDDGSTDRTGLILQRCSQEDKRLRWLQQSHQGIVAALNAGLQACRSDLIARMDADDCCHPMRLELQAAFLAEHPEVAVLGCRVEAIPHGQVRQGLQIYLEWQNSLLTDADIRREVFVECPLAHPSLMIRRNWLERVGGYQEVGWAEDYDLVLRLYLAGATFAKLPQVLLSWRERPERLTRSDRRYALENFLRAKAFYLARGPCASRDAVIIWGAGMIGRRLGKHLLRQGVPLKAYADIDPRKIGGHRHGLPVLAPEALPGWWQGQSQPLLLAAVGARGARPLIRRRLAALGMQEGSDWLFTA